MNRGECKTCGGEFSYSETVIEVADGRYCEVCHEENNEGKR